jgi:hypothetical protein
MKYLAIDLAKVGATGLAAFDGEKLLWSGVVKYGKKGPAFKCTYSSQGDVEFDGRDAPSFWRFLAEEFKVFIYEGLYLGKSAKTAMILAETRGMVKGWVHELDVSHRILEISEWREAICKHVGIANWPRDREEGKKLSLRIAEQLHGFEPSCDDEADALLVGTAFRLLGGLL